MTAAKAAQALRLRLFDLSDMDCLPGRENAIQALAGAAT